MWKRAYLGLAAFVLAAFLLAGCSAAAPAVGRSSSAPPAANSAPSDSGGEKAPAPAAAPPAPAGSVAAPGSPSSTGSSPGGAGGASGQTIDRKIIRDASLTLEVKNIDAAIAEVTNITELSGGYVFSTNFRDSGPNNRSAVMALRIPGSQYDQTMIKLRKVALKVREEKSSAQDVSEEYSDLAAQLRNLQATEAQYQELLKRANTIDDVLKVQQKLGETRGQIERIQGRMNFLDKRSDMASVTLTFTPEAVGQDTPTGWDPLGIAHRAFDASLAVLQGIASAIIVLVAFLWWTVPLALAIYGTVRLLLARRRTAPRAA
jgi:hypothetical protein